MKVDYEPTNTEEQLDTEEASLDSGNRKLGLLAGAVVLLIGAAIAFVPAENRERISNGQMPSFELLGASVVGTREAEVAETPAPAEAAAPAVGEVKKSGEVKKVTKATAAQQASANAAEQVTVAPVAVSEPLTQIDEVPEPVAAVEEAPNNVTIKGRVLDENGKPLAGATVFVKGTRKFASTDQHGNYSVEAPAGDNTLVYGYGGYEDQEMRSRAGLGINVTLVPSENGRKSRRR